MKPRVMEPQEVIAVAVSFTDAASPSAARDAMPVGTPGDIDAALALARSLGARRATPGDGTTREQWELLAGLASEDLAVARAIEPHLDAVAILVQAGWRQIEGTLGVFAAEGGPKPLTAEPAGQGWRLNGVKPWCSLAGRLDAALVTARTAAGDPRLFLVELDHPGVHVIEREWPARGLSEIPSGPVRFTDVEARAVGEPGWYLNRPGFAWGSIGVAACWYGGAVGIARTVLAAARETPDPHLLAHLGAIDVLLQACRTGLADAAQRADRRPPDAPHGDERLLARRIRGLVARTGEEVITRAGHALGPAALAMDAAHAKRVADLQLYLRQHHAERDDAALGARIADGEGSPW